jgi:hypothetical protein
MYSRNSYTQKAQHPHTAKKVERKGMHELLKLSISNKKPQIAN